MASGRSGEIEARLRRFDGVYRWFLFRATASFDDGRVIKWYGTNTDIEDLKRVEDALKRSEAYLAEAQRLTHTGSCAIDGTSREILYWSEEMFRLFGFDPQQGLPSWDQWVQRIHAEDRDKFKMAGDRTFLEKLHCDVEFRTVTPDGTAKQIHGIGDPVLSLSGELIQVVGTMIDVTERTRADAARERLRQLEADLAHMNRVSTVGELTASLAHEIKQPIGAAVTNAEVCVRLLDRAQPNIGEAHEAALEMVKDARRAADIIDRVRSLYQKGSSELESIEVNAAIGEMVLMLQNEANRHSVTVRADLAEGLPAVMADRVQLQQVLLNLMLNGIEAIRDTTGELSIKSQLAEDGQLLISVTDTGVGLPTENVDQIFDPFFTTKYKGTGLGLAITRSIVESRGGRIWATPNSGPGATFYFTMPSRGGGCMSTDAPTVFIVDDDGRMRAAMQRLLKTVGLHSESFATPQDFLRRNASRRSELPPTRYATSRNERPGTTKQTKRDRSSHPHHFHHQPRGYSHDCESHEVWRGRISDQAFPRSGPDRCNSAGVEDQCRSAATTE